MYKNFDKLYNEAYANFYNTCEYKELISADPIPYKIDESLRAVGQHNKGTIIIKNPIVNTFDEVRILTSILYHEFTHYYDEIMFKNFEYSNGTSKFWCSHIQKFMPRIMERLCSSILKICSIKIRSYISEFLEICTSK